MKNRLFSVVIALFIAFTFTTSSLAQDLRDDPQQGDFPDGVKVRPEKGLPGKVNVYDIKYSPDGTRLAVAGDFGILLYDVQTDDKPIKLTGNTGRAWNIAFCPDRNILASASPSGTIRLLDTNTGQLLRTLKGDKKLLIWGVSYSPDGNTIISRHNEVMDSTIRLWDTDTGKLLRTLSGHTQQISHMAFSPDSKIIASGSEDKTICLWDANTGKLLRTLIGHRGTVWNVAFSPDGKTIACTSGSSAIYLWDANTGQHIRTITGHYKLGFAGNVVVFSPDGKTIASGGVVGEVHLWDVKTGRHLRTLISGFSP